MTVPIKDVISVKVRPDEPSLLPPGVADGRKAAAMEGRGPLARYDAHVSFVAFLTSLAACSGNTSILFGIERHRGRGIPGSVRRMNT